MGRKARTGSIPVSGTTTNSSRSDEVSRPDARQRNLNRLPPSVATGRGPMTFFKYFRDVTLKSLKRAGLEARNLQSEEGREVAGGAVGIGAIGGPLKPRLERKGGAGFRGEGRLPGERLLGREGAGVGESVA